MLKLAGSSLFHGLPNCYQITHKLPHISPKKKSGASGRLSRNRPVWETNQRECHSVRYLFSAQQNQKSETRKDNTVRGQS